LRVLSIIWLILGHLMHRQHLIELKRFHVVINTS
jgi:hypothetical protein